MSRIIKAADLQVFIPNESQTVIPAQRKNESDPQTKGTVLEAANLLKNAQDKAETILAEAQTQAKQLLADAEQEIESIQLRAKETGFEEGYREGSIEGKKEGLEQTRSVISLLEQTLAEAMQVRARSLQALEDDFLKFSLLLADKIVRRSVNDDISWLSPIVNQALETLGRTDEIVIHLNPVDHALIEAIQAQLDINTRVNIQFEQDPSISQGGCLIESEHGLIDARLEQRLGKIGQHLQEVLYDDYT